MKNNEKIYSNLKSNDFLNNPRAIQLMDIIAENAYGCSLENIFITFKSKSDILYLIFSTLSKSIIAYNLNKMKIITEIKNAHEDYIDNFRYNYDIKNKKDIILSISSGDNNIKIWDINNFNCIYNINKLYKVGIILSACFLINKDINYIITCNCFLYNILVVDFKGNKIKEINNSSNYTIYIDIFFDVQKNKNYIITGNKTNVKSYDYERGELYYTYSDNFSSHHRSIIVYNDQNIVKIIFPCEEGFIRIFDFHKGIILNKINVNKALLGICLWNKKYLFIGTKNKSLDLIDLQKGELIKSLSGHNHWTCSVQKIYHLKFGEYLISQGLDNRIKLWVIKNSKEN